MAGAARGCHNRRMVGGSSQERVRGDLVRLVHRGAGVREFSIRAARILASAVPFDGVCVLTTDPSTRLPTAEVVENGLPPAATRRLTEIEMRGEDFNTFDALADSEQGAATLSDATNGDLERSVRHRELKRPNGFGDELRAVLAGDGAGWGRLTLLRASDRRHFTREDAAFVASVSRHLAEGLRRAMLLTAATTDQPVDDDEAVGFALLAADSSITMANPAAERWLSELGEKRSGRTASVRGDRGREPSAHHRARARGDGRRRSRACSRAIRALAGHPRLRAQRRRRCADGRDHRARSAA